MSISVTRAPYTIQLLLLFFHLYGVAQLQMIQCQSALAICTHHHHFCSLIHNIHYSFSLSSADSIIVHKENTGDYLCAF